MASSPSCHRHHFLNGFSRSSIALTAVASALCLVFEIVGVECLDDRLEQILETRELSPQPPSISSRQWESQVAAPHRTCPNK
jgi:hypothetical protein